MAKIISFLVICVLALWAFLPADDAGGEASASGDTVTVDGPRQDREVKHVLHVVPGIYMPGTSPVGVSGPLSGMREVARDFQRLYPDTQIKFMDVPATQREWLVTQLSSGQAPDILQVNVEDVWQDTQKGWYVPFDKWLEEPNPFVEPGEPGSVQWWDQFKYQTITRGKIAPDGRMYCIPLDMIETGIYYNKTMFRRMGLREPTTWEEFLALQQEILEAGITPLTVDPVMLADWGVDLIFDQLYFDVLNLLNLQTHEAAGEYLENYLDLEEVAFLRSQGFFTEEDPRFVEVWRLMKEWRRYLPASLSTTAGGIDASRLQSASFLRGEVAMFWNVSSFVNQLVLDPDLDFEWGVFYPPGMNEATSRFASSERSMCVIGGAAMQYSLTNSSFDDTGDPATSEKLARCVQFLQFLCLPENTDRVVNELLCFLPNIKGVESWPQLDPFAEILERPYTIIKWAATFDLRFSEVQRRMLELYLNEDISAQEMAAEMGRWIEASAVTARQRKNLGADDLAPAWREALRKAAADPPPGLPAGVEAQLRDVRP